MNGIPRLMRIGSSRRRIIVRPARCSCDTNENNFLVSSYCPAIVQFDLSAVPVAVILFSFIKLFTIYFQFEMEKEREKRPLRSIAWRDNENKQTTKTTLLASHIAVHLFPVGSSLGSSIAFERFLDLSSSTRRRGRSAALLLDELDCLRGRSFREYSRLLGRFLGLLGGRGIITGFSLGSLESSSFGWIFWSLGIS